MAQAFADQLGWVGKSRTLADSIERAASYARKLGHTHVRLDHLLLALTEDLDAVMVFGACHVDTARLRMDLHQRLAHGGERVSPNESRTPAPDAEMRRVFDYASQAADQSRRGHIDGAIVLAALIGEATTDAADLLRSYGMTFEEVIRSLQAIGAAGGASAGPAAAPPPAQPPPSAAPTLATTPRPVAPPAPVRPAPGPASPGPPRSPPGNTAPARAPQPTRPLAAQSYAQPVARPSPPPQAAGQERAPALAHRPLPAAMDGPPRPFGSNGAAHYPNGHLGASFPGRSSPPLPAAPQQRTGRVGSPAGYPSAPMQQLDELDPRLHPAPQGPPPLQQRPAPAVDTGQLVENIPRTMRAGSPELIEIRIARARLDAIADGMQGRGPQHRHEIFITRAMTVRLRAPEGSLRIETMSPETQWLDSSSRMGLVQDEFAAWKFAVTPERRGKARLQVAIAARTVGADGLVAETALPEQTIDIRVRVNFARSLKRAAGWALAAAVGGIIGVWGEMAFQFGLSGASRMIAKLLLPH